MTMLDLTPIKARIEAARGERPTSDGVYWLPLTIAEAQSLVDEIETLRKRVAELESFVKAVCPGWSEHGTVTLP